MAWPPLQARLIDNHGCSSLVPLIGFPSFRGGHTGETGQRPARSACGRLPAPSRHTADIEVQSATNLPERGRQFAINTHGVQAQPLAKLTAVQLPLLSNFFLEINEKYICYKQYLV